MANRDKKDKPAKGKGAPDIRTQIAIARYETHAKSATGKSKKSPKR